MTTDSNRIQSNKEVSPHGGALINLLASAAASSEWRSRQQTLPVLPLNPRQLADVEMLSLGAVSPLRGFMGKKDYDAVIDGMHLANGLAWTIPLTLAVTQEDAGRFEEGQPIGLTEDGTLIAVLHLEEKFPADRSREASQVYRTRETAHPGVRALYQEGDILLGGPLEVLKLPTHSDFLEYRLSPAQTRRLFAERGWTTVVGFQTRNPVHRAHEYLTKCALESYDGLLLHPLAGDTPGGGVPLALRMKSYEVLLEHYYPKSRVILSMNPGNMYYAGPREAVHHALIRKNFGCTHFIVGRDHAGSGAYYGAHDAQKIFEEFQFAELGITPVFYENSFYCKTCQGMASEKTCPHGAAERVSSSGTQVRELLSRKQMLPVEISRPEVAKILIG